MREITLYGKKYWIDGRGETMLIYMDEFHMDLFTEMTSYMLSIARGDIAPSTGSRLAYAMIKTANPDVVKSGYPEFIKGFKSIGAFGVSDTFIEPLLDEITDLMETGEEKEADSKKNGTPEN